MKMRLGDQIPEWRRGAYAWAPLADGREITVYPLLFGAARLCVGPLADEYGYDNAYMYDSLRDAMIAAETWDYEKQQHPPDFVKIEAGDDHAADQIPEVGKAIKVRTDRDTFTISEKDHGDNVVELQRRLKNGARIGIRGLEKRDVDGRLFCEVTDISIDNSDLVRPDDQLPPDATPNEKLDLAFPPTKGGDDGEPG